jgi:hypothetical protein
LKLNSVDGILVCAEINLTLVRDRMMVKQTSPIHFFFMIHS